MKKVILKTLAVLCAIAISSGAWADKKHSNKQEKTQEFLPNTFYVIDAGTDIFMYVDLDDIKQSRHQNVKRYNRKIIMPTVETETEETVDVNCSLHLERRVVTTHYYLFIKEDPEVKTGDKEWQDIFEDTPSAKAEDIVCKNINPKIERLVKLPANIKQQVKFAGKN